ncbi:MAG: DUF1080 domain-containing protein [Phycisphaerales bacterium]|nr:DUF1080 domain-containing protein [Phycisphaerales bacterium]
MSRNHLVPIWILALIMVSTGWKVTSAQEDDTPTEDTQAAPGLPQLLGNWNILLTDTAQNTLHCWLGITEIDGNLTARFNAWSGGLHQVPAEYKDGNISFAIQTRNKGRDGTDYWVGTLKREERQGPRANRTIYIIEGTTRFEQDDQVRSWTARPQVIRVNPTGTWSIDSIEGLPQAERKLLIKREGRQITGRFIDNSRSETLENPRVRRGELVATVPMRGTDQEPTPHTLRATIKGDVLEGAFIAGKQRYAFTARRDRQWETPIELFNGQNLDHWIMNTGQDIRESAWQIVDGALCMPKVGENIMTKQKYDDFKIDLEFKVPEKGNSGVYLRGRHEVQISDSLGKPLNPGSCGAIYGRITPTTDACKAHGEWQRLEVTLISMYVTVKLNEQTIIDNILIEGMTGGALDNDDNAPGPIYLQGNHSPVCYRNIRITPAKAPVAPEDFK